MSHTNILEISPDAIKEIRKRYNLDEPGKIEEAIEILEKWILQENHILKKDFERQYLEKTLLLGKGSVERAKKIIDGLCTMRTVIPNFFTINNSDFEPLLTDMNVVPLPELTKDFYRVVLLKLPNRKYTPEIVFLALQYCVMVTEYLFRHDYCNGFFFVDDLLETNIIDFVTNLTKIDIQQFASILLRGYCCRVKGVHLVSQSKGIDLFKNIVSQFLSNKLKKRIHVHKNFEDVLDKYIPKDIFPKEYGGKERPLKTMMKNWSDIILSKENMDSFKLMSKAGTDESLRKSGKFNEEYMGMPGSFRNLKVD